MRGEFRISGILALSLLSLSLGSCGVKGGLEDPPTAEEQKTDQQQREERDEGWWERLLP